MVYLPPFAIHGTYLLSQSELENCGSLYRRLLERLSRGSGAAADIRRYSFIDEWVNAVETGEKP
jgi:hypothetical protein